MVGVNLLILVGSGFVFENISMSAHVGGAIAGAVLSVPLAWLGPFSPVRHRVIGLVSLALIGGVCAVSLAMAPRPQPEPHPERPGPRVIVLPRDLIEKQR